MDPTQGETYGQKEVERESARPAPGIRLPHAEGERLIWRCILILKRCFQRFKSEVSSKLHGRALEFSRWRSGIETAAT